MSDTVTSLVGPYLQRHWPNCPAEVLAVLRDQVAPAAENHLGPCATDLVLQSAATWPWYPSAPVDQKQRFHQLTGHFMRVARGYVVARTAGGNPRKLKAGNGPHTRFTLQVPPVSGQVGLFWVVETNAASMVLALSVPLERADPYDDMLTLDIGHDQHWDSLRERGAQALRLEGLPTAPVWSEYDEWPRGRVIYDCSSRIFVIRADRKLHNGIFVEKIAARFEINAIECLIVPDDHYVSVRQIRPD